MQKVYSRINWENDPSTNTAINEDNLNKMDYALDKIDDRVVQLAGYEERAKTSEENAKASEESAELKRQQAENSAVLSKSYAIGGTGTRENEDVENAKFYYEQAKRISQGLSGTLLPCGTIAFEELADVQVLPGYMYNISNDFVTDDRFIHSGIFHGAGANIYMTIDGKWDVLAGSNVVSVNGITGVVILKAADIECSDGETVQSKLDKIGIISNLTTMVKDTIVGAINWIVEQLNTLNTNLANQQESITELNSKLQWKLLGEVTGANTLTLPNTYKELKVIATIDGNFEYVYLSDITKEVIDDGAKYFYEGFFFNDSSNGSIRIEVADNKIGVGTLYFAKVDVKDKAKMRVYYR